MLYPASARASAAASPKPLLAPRINPQRSLSSAIGAEHSGPHSLDRRTIALVTNTNRTLLLVHAPPGGLRGWAERPVSPRPPYHRPRDEYEPDPLARARPPRGREHLDWRRDGPPCRRRGATDLGGGQR